MKDYCIYIMVCLFLGWNVIYSQSQNNALKFNLKGRVEVRSTGQPISGVSISNDMGMFVVTNALGEFEIKTRIGDQLIIEHQDIETLWYNVEKNDDVLILVEGFESSVSDRSNSPPDISIRHQQLLDSAEHYKAKDIEKSIDFVAQSIALLGKRGRRKELARSLSKLGEVYQYHKQLDLAIDNYEDALENNKTIATSLLLGRAYNLMSRFNETIGLLDPLSKVKTMPPYQSAVLYELLGDAKKGEGKTKEAIELYNRGLLIAEKNQNTSKMIDLNSKLADSYSMDNQAMEAEAYYGNSLELAVQSAPKRALQEKEKVADFYNTKSRFNEEINMRKSSLQELKRLNAPNVGLKKLELGDTITSQRINYKIANAYISQDRYNEAIPFLEKSIVEADSDDDLVVQKDATRKLSEVYKVKGDFTKALETYQTYVALVDSLYVRKEQEISRASRFNREIANAQNRLTGLEQERELSQSKYDLALTEQELVKESNKRQQLVIYSLIFGLLLTLLAAFFFYRSNQQQKLANNLLALKSLRSQMNPHFIFNALNSVNNFISKSDERSANRYLSDFSKLMRSVLENSEEDFIPLEKELQQLELYIKLEHSRFEDKFDYQITVDESVQVSKFQIPPMLLQPYIENAIWHGLRYREEKGELLVDVKENSEDSIIISITDNGIGRKKSAEIKTQNQKKQKSKGMGIIQKRVAILNDMYTDKVDIKISDLQENGTGTKVLFILKREK
ncbi:Tetratricopeptide repeat-containing protein [Maribacter dokdonensis]|uniref:Tetratricopeptide repeat-containing protein n=1 Tax=Maribacter dokdonensis TaxID=320912 RepID=A0A1H4N062_9FLAO|nr:histidine kinase [Maribacter dokdonensis]SEB88135.1 Tetratricopeptide repeat-containing protein [Maribacter dokdonensis]